MQEKDLIEKYLKNRNFSTNKLYVELIESYVLFKEQYLKTLTKENTPSKVLKATKQEVKKKW